MSTAIARRQTIAPILPWTIKSRLGRQRVNLNPSRSWMMVALCAIGKFGQFFVAAHEFAFDGSDGILSTSTMGYRFSLADSPFACTRTGMSASAFCQSDRKS